MRLVKLGNSDLEVSKIGLGCLQMSRGRGISGKLWPTLHQNEINAIIRASVYNNVNWFDTAELYGWGESEKALSRSFSELGIDKSDVIIATKWWPLLRTAGSITGTIDKRLECLGADVIDLYQIHHPYSFSSIASQMREMAKLVGAGKIRYIGVSNFSASAMRRASRALSEYGIPLVSNQVNYSLLKRDIETNGVLDTARELGITIIAYSPLARGMLTSKFHDRPELIDKRNWIRKYYGSLNKRKLKQSRPVIRVLKELAGKYVVTPSQIALAWTVCFHGDSVVAIPGATTPGQATDNARTMTIELTDDELYRLDQTTSGFK